MPQFPVIGNLPSRHIHLGGFAVNATSFICVRPEARRNERRRNRGPIRVHSLRRESCFRMALTGCQRRSIPSSYIEVPLSWQFAIRRLTLCFTMPACHPCRRIQSLVKDRQSWGCLSPTSAHALPAYFIDAHYDMAEACGSRIEQLTSKSCALAALQTMRKFNWHN